MTISNDHTAVIRDPSQQALTTLDIQQQEDRKFKLLNVKQKGPFLGNKYREKLQKQLQRIEEITNKKKNEDK